jgi:urease accessory protein UreF
MTPDKFEDGYWMAKPAKDLTREELFEVIDWFIRDQASTREMRERERSMNRQFAEARR